MTADITLLDEGCDQTTYSNACFAGQNGITTYDDGQCLNGMAAAAPNLRQA